MTITLNSLSGKFHHPLSDDPLQVCFHTPFLPTWSVGAELSEATKDLAETILHFLSHFSVFFTPAACFIFFKKFILSLVFTTLFCYLYNLSLSYSSKLTCSLFQEQILFKIFLKINVCLAASGLCCWIQAFFSCGAQASHCGGSSCCGAQALGARASARGFISCGSRALECRSVVVVHGLSCSVAYGIFWTRD